MSSVVHFEWANSCKTNTANAFVVHAGFRCQVWHDRICNSLSLRDWTTSTKLLTFSNWIEWNKIGNWCLGPPPRIWENLPVNKLFQSALKTSSLRQRKDRAPPTVHHVTMLCRARPGGALAQVGGGGSSPKNRVPAWVGGGGGSYTTTRTTAQT